MLLGDEEDGRDAQTSVYAMYRAQGAIQVAETENRFNNLDLAQTLLADAHELFDLGKFTDADAMAISAETTANTATVPLDYSQAAQLLKSAEVLKNSTIDANSHQAVALVQQANEQLGIAKHAFDLRDFSTTKEAAQAAIDLFNRAKQMQLYDTYPWLAQQPRPIGSSDYSRICFAISAQACMITLIRAAHLREDIVGDSIFPAPNYLNPRNLQERF